jgi:hypothetical protein
MNKVCLIRYRRENFHSLVNLDIIDLSEFMSHTGHFAKASQKVLSWLVGIRSKQGGK